MIQTQKIAGPRILAEGAAILASILLAFSIDAWWKAARRMSLASVIWSVFKQTSHKWKVRSTNTSILLLA